MTNQSNQNQHGGAKSGKDENLKTGKPDQGERRHMDETRSGERMREANDTGTQRNIDENRSGNNRQSWETERRDADAQSNERDREDREGATREANQNANRSGQAMGGKDKERDAGRG